MLLTVPAVAVKLAVVAPAATVTDAGTVSAALLSETVTLEPPAGAAAERLTVQFDLAPEARAAGVHCREETETVELTLMTPPLAETLTAAPAGDAPTTLVMEIASDELLLLLERVAVTTATTPEAIPDAFRPLARQVRDPAPETQLSVLPALVRAAPAVAFRELMSLGE